MFLFFSLFFFFTLTPIPGVKGDYSYSQLRHNCTSHYLQEWLCASWKNTADRADSLTSSLSLTAIDPRCLIYTFVLLHTRLYSTFNYFPSFPFFHFIYLYQLLFTLCAFHSTKIPVWNFGNSGYTDPTQATARFLCCSCKQDTKEPYWGQQFVKWKGTFQPNRPKWPDLSK